MDDVIPFQGVQKYVKKLKECIRVHRANDGLRDRSPGKANELRGKASATNLDGSSDRISSFSNRLLRRNTLLSHDSERPLQRGTVLLRELRHQGHYLSNNVANECHEVKKKQFSSGTYNYDCVYMCQGQVRKMRGTQCTNINGTCAHALIGLSCSLHCDSEGKDLVLSSATCSRLVAKTC